MALLALSHAQLSLCHDSLSPETYTRSLYCILGCGNMSPRRAALPQCLAAPLAAPAAPAALVSCLGAGEAASHI